MKRFISKTLARDTIKFSDKGDCVIGIWPPDGVFKNYSLYITYTDDGEFRIGATGTGEALVGNDMESLLDAAFEIVAKYADKERECERLYNIICDTMHRMKGGAS